MQFFVFTPQHPVIIPNNLRSEARLQKGERIRETILEQKSLHSIDQIFAKSCVDNVCKPWMRFEMSADIETILYSCRYKSFQKTLNSFVSYGEKINQTKYRRMKAIGKFLEPKTCQLVQIMLYNAQLYTMRKILQSITELWNKISIWTTSCILPSKIPKAEVWNEISSLCYKKVVSRFLNCNQTFTNFSERESDAESFIALGLEWSLISEDLKLCRWFVGKKFTEYICQYFQYNLTHWV